jgi:hypothetical protein
LDSGVGAAFWSSLLGFSGAGSEIAGLVSRREVGRKVEKAAAVVKGKRSVWEWDGATERRAWGPAALRINSCRADDLQAEQREARSTDTGIIVFVDVDVLTLLRW